MKYKKTKGYPSPEWCILASVIEECAKKTKRECQNCQWSASYKTEGSKARSDEVTIYEVTMAIARGGKS